ncbi:MAG: PKD domain-containing protein [Nitrospira sp.]|nr:PKD domain-containing protein [Nitrospira sp.]
MSLHPDFPISPHAPLIPERRWFPADEVLREAASWKLLPPLVAKVRQEVFAWRTAGYAGASSTSKALLRYWFETEHLVENADGSLSPFRYYFAQREAVETVIWLFEVRQARDKYDLLRFDASEAVSSGMFDEDWPRYVLKMATGAFIFENEWQSFRTRKNRDLELKSATHAYDKPGRYTVAVKVIDIFGNDTMTLVPVTVG